MIFSWTAFLQFFLDKGPKTQQADVKPIILTPQTSHHAETPAASVTFLQTAAGNVREILQNFSEVRLPSFFGLDGVEDGLPLGLVALADLLDLLLHLRVQRGELQPQILHRPRAYLEENTLNYVKAAVLIHQHRGPRVCETESQGTSLRANIYFPWVWRALTFRLLSCGTSSQFGFRLPPCSHLSALNYSYEKHKVFWTLNVCHEWTLTVSFWYTQRVTTTFEAGFDDLRVKDQRGRSPLVDADKNLYRALKVRHTWQQ